MNNQNSTNSIHSISHFFPGFKFCNIPSGNFYLFTSLRIPSCAALADIEKVPKPIKVTLSPFCSVSVTASTNQVNALSAAALLMSADAAIAARSSDLFIV